MRFGTGLLVGVSGTLCWSGVAIGATAPKTLVPGQSVSVAGTSIVCAYVGPAGKTAIDCFSTKSGAPGYGFRLNENELVAYKSAAGAEHDVKRWREPASLKQPSFAAAQQAQLVASLPVGGRVLIAKTDIGCLVYSNSNVPVVACFKLAGTQGYPLTNSLAGSISSGAMQVSRFDASHKGVTVFVGEPGQKP